MTESKPIYSKSFKKPSIYRNKYIINDEPLSTDQLYEIITSQNMIIDVALAKNGKLVNAMKEIQKIVKWHILHIKPSIALEIISIIDKSLNYSIKE